MGNTFAFKQGLLDAGVLNDVGSRVKNFENCLFIVHIVSWWRIVLNTFGLFLKTRLFNRITQISFQIEQSAGTAHLLKFIWRFIPVFPFI
jgi:hypothetical protein